MMKGDKHLEELCMLIYRGKNVRNFSIEEESKL